MTVLGSGTDAPEGPKAGDKALLVAGSVPELEAAVLPGRARLISLRRRRSQLSVALVIVFVIVVLAGLFLTVCFVRKIGPFRRHFDGFCPVGSRRFNGHRRVFESYEITDKYALIQVPKFNLNRDTYDSVRTLHIFDKRISVIQHNGICFLKPMMKYQVLHNDWFDNLKKLSHNDFPTPNRFSHFYMRIVRPQLPVNYLKDEIDHMAAAICNDRPVFRLVFQINSRSHPWIPKCNIKCNNCYASEQVISLQMINGRKCRVCKCKREDAETVNMSPLKSSNKLDGNCKSIRCENKCANKDLVGCVKCICLDTEHNDNQKMNSPSINQGQLSPMIDHVDDNSKHDAAELPNTNKGDKQKSIESPLFQERTRFQPIFDYDARIHRRKRTAETNCKLMANIYEGYTPLDIDTRVPLDHIYDC